ncbi:PEP-CTERM sorting domain-containing protein [Thalassotalea sp. LPB0316]|uniref:PEP-CTERM sorting domain-containing protein n=1 Tax=Thalassotalea sp. LPB0316 TaxID=2769490 RepID=UPI001D043EB9|nr:PEP-CTERM sorting domain-containing protein [Thalassotalea sp. LPB0316]
MKFKFLAIMFVGVMLSVSMSAKAGIIHTFVFDDLSKWQTNSNFQVGDSLTVEFANSTDFNNVFISDILGIQFNLQVGNTTKVEQPNLLNNCWPNCNAAFDMFSLVDGKLAMTFKHTDPQIGFNGSNGTGTYVQLYMQGGNSGAYNMYSQFQTINGIGNAWLGFVNEGETIQYFASPIKASEPSTLAILALGIIGLASRRFKKQS